MKVLILWERNDYVDSDGRENCPEVDGLYASLDAINRHPLLTAHGIKFDSVNQKHYVDTWHWWIHEMEVTE